MKKKKGLIDLSEYVREVVQDMEEERKQNDEKHYSQLHFEIYGTHDVYHCPRILNRTLEQRQKSLDEAIDLIDEVKASLHRNNN